jgi:hypothetical protein
LTVDFFGEIARPDDALVMNEGGAYGHRGGHRRGDGESFPIFEQQE